MLSLLEPQKEVPQCHQGNDTFVYESEHVPDTFTPGSSVETNHALLAAIRENGFDTSDLAYSDSLKSLTITERREALLVFMLGFAKILVCTRIHPARTRAYKANQAFYT